ncbi:hypothetical protein [Mycoplasmopsis felifaucium]|uniref:Extracellular matrix-binding protein ebh GA module domain-containing protein n=1 Tax=Mycoplasmopsis felifaucium TaxID=35768 RepID=A0ABZ2RSX4_9BACT
MLLQNLEQSLSSILQKAEAQYNKYKNNDKLTTQLENLKNAINQAKQDLSNNPSSIDIIKNSDNLSDKIFDLLSSASTADNGVSLIDQLKNEIARAQKFVGTNKSNPDLVGEITKLNDAIANAQKLDENSNNEDINNALNNLANNLDKAYAVKDLMNAINQAKNEANNLKNPNQKSSKESLQEAIDKAKELLENSNNTSENLDKSAEDLQNLVSNIINENNNSVQDNEAYKIFIAKRKELVAKWNEIKNTSNYSKIANYLKNIYYGTDTISKYDPVEDIKSATNEIVKGIENANIRIQALNDAIKALDAKLSLFDEYKDSISGDKNVDNKYAYVIDKINQIIEETNEAKQNGTAPDIINELTEYLGTRLENIKEIVKAVDNFDDKIRMVQRNLDGYADDPDGRQYKETLIEALNEAKKALNSSDVEQLKIAEQNLFKAWQKFQGDYNSIDWRKRETLNNYLDYKRRLQYIYEVLVRTNNDWEDERITQLISIVNDELNSLPDYNNSNYSQTLLVDITNAYERAKSFVNKDTLERDNIFKTVHDAQNALYNDFQKWQAEIRELIYPDDNRARDFDENYFDTHFIDAKDNYLKLYNDFNNNKYKYGIKKLQETKTEGERFFTEYVAKINEVKELFNAELQKDIELFMKVNDWRFKNLNDDTTKFFEPLWYEFNSFWPNTDDPEQALKDLRRNLYNSWYNIEGLKNLYSNLSQMFEKCKGDTEAYIKNTLEPKYNEFKAKYNELIEKIKAKESEPEYSQLAKSYINYITTTDSFSSLINHGDKPLSGIENATVKNLDKYIGWFNTIYNNFENKIDSPFRGTNYY